MKDDEKGVYVGSGGFRVDRSRMLAQLARFGYTHGHFALIGLVRCAVLGNAARVGIRGLPKKGFSFNSYDGLEIEFDGEPFDEAALRNPYDCLFGDSSDRRRLSQLARALLTLSQTRPKELTLTSGPAGKRFELSVQSLTEDAVRPVEGSGPTVLHVVWESLASPQIQLLYGLTRLVEKRLRHSPIPIDLTNVWVFEDDTNSRRAVAFRPAGPGAEAHLSFDREGMRGRVEMPVRIVPAEGRLSLCWAGAEVESTPKTAFLPVPVDGFIDYAGFNLDLSAGAIVRDASFEAAVAALSREATALAVRVSREQPWIMEETAALLSSSLSREIWTGTHDGRISNAPEASWWNPRSTMETLETRRKVYKAAVRARWLRYCARNVARRDSSTPELKEALYATPLYFSTAREPLSLARLRGIMERLGKIPASARLGAAGPQPGPVLWLSSTRDAALLPDSFAIKRLR